MAGLRGFGKGIRNREFGILFVTEMLINLSR